MFDGKKTNGVGQSASDRRRRRLWVRGAVTVAAAGALLGGLASTASAGGSLLWATPNSHGQRLAVCAQDLEVRSSPGGPAIGYLYGPNQTFTVYDAGAREFGGEWVLGHAWGNVNRDGYVQNGWFC
ncbi:hypothetical protein [Parafrankia sp. EUN1f]|uniref:hypothetical protein n=1 Tax=Parafrankia sp. EUN1f TaxID=102897 RepID=UPI0001C45305|nr:hypothetical protein [Parafrankia sp. EUN1f]EFC78990.1 hypothetical protein FrEUN1fDRAFT_7894 [Parafrankia sp. EUN1f]